MRRNGLKIGLAISAAIAFGAPSAGGQTLAQITTAALSSEGEGALFMLAGNDAFRTGAALRFRLTSSSDIGFELGLDLSHGVLSIGGGVDAKLALLQSRDDLPLALALDLSGGFLDSDEASLFELAFGVIASGVLKGDTGLPIEPYLSLIAAARWYESELPIICDPPGAVCTIDRDRREADTIVRGGVKIAVSRESQIIVEVSIDDYTLVGAAFNLVF